MLYLVLQPYCYIWTSKGWSLAVRAIVSSRNDVSVEGFLFSTPNKVVIQRWFSLHVEMVESSVNRILKC